MTLTDSATDVPTGHGRSGDVAIDLGDPCSVDLRDAAGLAAIVDELCDDGRVVHVERLAQRAERIGELERPLPPHVWQRLGIDHLWSHQAAAIDHVRRGSSVVVATGTASGKSLCYQAPIAELAADRLRPATALLLFPTKALAHDQLRAFTEPRFDGLRAATYDGDTPSENRAWVRDHANVILTNPEMLHAGVLPHHRRWATFLRRLRIVVIDELHVLRGVFGTHVAHLLRRLRRLCAHYGSSPTFVFSSATIGRPGELASALCGLPVTEITDDGAPRGPRLFALLDPPVLDARSGTRTTGNAETAALVRRLIDDDRRVIAFCRSRKGTELVAADVRRRLPASLATTVQSYRSGYLAAERREIEAALADGTVRAVAATTALELGVDIGGLDACVLNGFPGTIASLWQQAGRAGRHQQASLAVLVAGEDQLDRYLVSHPAEVFSRPPEPAVINPSNPFVLLPHLACASYELPLAHADRQYWGDDLDEGVRDLVLDDTLVVRRRPARGPDAHGDDEPVALWNGPGVPGRDIGLRSGSSSEIRIVDRDGDLIGTVDSSRAPALVHPGAVYLHRGCPYRVQELDLDERRAVVSEDDGETYTQARTDTDITVIGIDRQTLAGTVPLHLGDVEVTSRVTGFQRKDVRTRKILANEQLDLPPQQLLTRAVWFTVDHALIEAAGVGPADLPGTLHAIEHAAIGMLPLFTICDRWDVGGVSTAMHRDTAAPTIFIHDAYPGGAGIAELGYDAAPRLLGATLELLRACSCADGCPSCVQSPKCGNGNEPLDKAGAIALLDVLLGG
ncbi:MAG: DEAD/DEAH box helicase [Acidimicrobiales bacterium]|nr:DEAD/DEAH box helicase [Acidimicrobiales bacterium]